MLADSIAAHNPFPNYAEVPFHETDKGGDREVVTDWTMDKEVQPVASALTDYDFKKPKTSLLSSSHVTRQYGHAQFEMFDYPGEYVEHADGEQLADVRLGELQCQYELLHGQATARGLAAGYLFKLKGHNRADQNREYLIKSVALRADAGEFSSTGERGNEWFFSCNFTCLDKTRQFRPARLTPEPVIQGVQTAIVTGPKGQEIYVDKYGRIKVQFHWDRYGKLDENSSCWVRVSQSWTGKKWGHIANPHLESEVVVSFLEGDPDRPIVVGRLYNDDQMPPYPLPAAAAILGSKSPILRATPSFKESQKS